MRISDRYQQSHVLRAIATQMAQLARAQDQATTGLRVSTVSDDPVAAPVIMRVSGSLRDIDQWLRNGTEATTRLSTEDATFTGAAQLLAQARQIGLDASGPNLDAATRQGLITEARQLLQQLVGFGNTKLGDEYIFGGTATDHPPFLADGTYVGDQGVRQAQLDGTQALDISHPGDTAFGSAIAAMKQLIGDLGTGNASSTTLSALDSAREDVLSIQAETGARLTQVKTAATTLGAQSASLLDQRDNLRGVDPTTASVQLVTLQSSIERAYAVIGKVLSVHLTDFLK